MGKHNELTCDVLVVGSGAAGLTVALRLADRCNVLVLSKDNLTESATCYAQGGIAAVMDSADSIALHAADTLAAGAGICDRQAVNFVTQHARTCVEWLIQQGVMFDTDPLAAPAPAYHLTREGGHSHRRILHAADATGRAVQVTLVNRALAHPNIRILEHTQAIDLLLSDSTSERQASGIRGMLILNRKTGQTDICRAKFVVLATGGASRVYQYSTNPDISSGDGIAIAWRAGCRVANLEFNQFHPTALYHPLARNFLLSEALRGEGALLKRPDGSRFMPDIDARAELAPRDIVARAIESEMKRLGTECMYLDISHQPPDFILRHFPNISQRLLELGIDLTKEAVPIVPAAHYTCGGIMVDAHSRTDISNLYAVGEVAYTGLHGANRLASNSLLECLVYGWSAAKDILARLPQVHHCAHGETIQAAFNRDISSEELAALEEMRSEAREIMWQHVGITRNNLSLHNALRQISTRQQAVARQFATARPCAPLCGLRDQLLVCELIVRCALLRRESRGLHYSVDYPASRKTVDKNTGPSVLTPASRSQATYS